MRYTYDYTDYDASMDDKVARHTFQDTKEDAEVRIYTENNEVVECIKVWYPSTRWGNFEPLGYMLKKIGKL